MYKENKGKPNTNKKDQIKSKSYSHIVRNQGSIS